MNKIKLYILASVGVAMLSACNDSFMDRYPETAPTEATAFVSSSNFEAYAWGLYATFPKIGYGSENCTDDISYNSARSTGEDAAIRGLWTVPTSQSGTAWNYYSFIRSVNLMLDNIDKSQMNDTEKNHWRSVGYFFRSYRYFTLLSTYGGVPWVDHVLSDSDVDILYGPRASRDEIAKHIFDDLKFAEKNINVNGNGANTINKACVQALLSRFTLFEGTWRKYHGLQDADTYLNECVRVSAELCASYPNLAPRYDDLFCSLDLSKVAGIILYREYRNDAGVVHDTSIQGTTAASYYNPTRDLVDSYLCCDGKTRWNSRLFQGDKDMYAEFACRDHRLWLHVTPPYLVDRSRSTNAWDNKWDYTANPKDYSYMDSLRVRMDLGLGSSDEHRKTLPFRQGFVGGILGHVPHYDFFLDNQPWYKSAFGYNNWKYYVTYLDEGGARNEEQDLPIFRIEETMLNYAEAAQELGKFTQDIADLTINKIRVRANVAPMKVSEINASFDPTRDMGDPQYKNDYEVNPLLWEIRRERRIELFSEGFRYDDLRRWKKCHYAMRQKLGCWVKKSDFPAGTNVTIDRDGNEGYLTFHPAQTHLWPEHYYLSPLPLNEMVLNPQLEQNPGWDGVNN